MSKHITAGEKCLKASSDTTKYDPLEVGHAVQDTIETNLYECIETHNKIFNEDEYCVGFVLASDPLLKNVVRRKFFAMLYLPSPRPNQTVFLYNKKLGYITHRLWCLPNALTMAKLAESTVVENGYETMKSWCDAFYAFKFWEFIRKQHGIKLLSESEYLNVNREKLIKATPNKINTARSESFDFSKITAGQFKNTDDILAN